MRIRSELTIGALCTALFLVGTAYAAAPYLTQTVQLPSNAGASGSMSAPAAARTATITLTAAEVAKHATPSDCWFIVRDTVYDVSAYAAAHPGGATAVTRFCGKDATQAFMTKGGKGSHSVRADRDLAGLAIGVIGTTLTVPPAANTQSAPQSGQGRTNARPDQEEDDD